MTKRWAILLGNENVWLVNGQPQTFASMEEAAAELERFFMDEEEFFELGYLEEPCNPEDYRIEEVV